MAEKSVDLTVIDVLKIKENELSGRLQAVLDERNEAIEAAKAKYAEALKEIKAKQGALKRMMKTATEKL